MRFFPIAEGVPRPLQLALTRRDYTTAGAKYSVTTLLKPPRIIQLERRYDDQIVIDARRGAKALLGTAFHDMLERKAKQYPEDCEIVEQIMLDEIEVTVDGRTYKVSVKGQNDLHSTDQLLEEGNLLAIEQGILYDYKTTSQQVARYGPKEEWTPQLNIYARQMRRRGIAVTGLRICPLFTDWRKKDGYSKFAIGDAIELRMWPNEQVDEFLVERVTLHEQCALLPDNDLPKCTSEDRWMRPSWRVRKTGDAKFKILRFEEDEQAARDKATELGPGHVAFFVGDEPRRCTTWCNAALVCQQFKREFPKEYDEQLQERLSYGFEPIKFK